MPTKFSDEPRYFDIVLASMKIVKKYSNKLRLCNRRHSSYLFYGGYLIWSFCAS